MRRITAIITIILFTAGLVWSGQLDDDMTVDQYFAAKQLTAKNFFDTEKMVDDLDDEDLTLTGDIYKFDAKSTKKAFFYSLVIPGAGQYYAGSRTSPLIFLGVEALLWSGYFVYNNKGDDKKQEYRAYADSHYVWQDFMAWWEGLSEAQQDSFSHRLPWDELDNTVVRNHEYYENIGKYDQFQIGWDDISNIAFPPPYGDAVYDGNRQVYLNMRRQSNDYYQNANTMIMLSLANRIVSAFHAALTAKNYNKGEKRFSFKVKTKEWTHGKVPMVTMSYNF